MIAWLTAVALAQEPLTFSAVRVVEHGEADPSLTFTPGVDGHLEVSLSCGPHPFRLATPLRRGAPVTLALSGLPPGTWACSGQVNLTDSQGGAGTMPLSLEVASLAPITWSWAAEDLDLAARTLVTHPSRPVADAVLTVRSAGAAVVDEVRADLADPSTPTFRWSSDAEVVTLVVEARDAVGFRGVLELSPWSYAIPHEDVVFGSGSADIVVAESPKVEATWVDTQGVLAKYGSAVEIQLFVAGYTDTVGPAAANQALSERRARAIAQWFRQRGFSGPIWYQGFGEDALAVPTADEVDEARNRRALYLLAAETPPTSADLPRAAWTRL